MSAMSYNIYTPYTYLIGWSAHNKWYYGVRYAKGCHPSDLWVKYFTSSDKVKEFRQIYGEPDVIQIRKTFTTHDKARHHEGVVLRRLRVLNEEKWINECFISTKLNCKVPGSKSGVPKSDEHRRKISEALRGRKQYEMTDEIRKKISDSSKGKTPGNKGKTYKIEPTEERKLKWSENGRLNCKRRWEKVKLLQCQQQE